MASSSSGLRRVIGGAFKFRALVLTGAVALAVFGFVQVPSTSVSMLPEFAPPTVEIQTEALGLSAAEVEQLITVPLEADLLNGVAWLDEIRSESIAGLSSIELVFEPGTDIMQARQVVAERLTQAHALPNVSRPPAMLQPLSSTSRVLMVSLSSETLSETEMSVLARWKIRPYLMGVPGVANVSIWGQRERQLQVQVDPQRLQDNGVTLAQIVGTTGNALWVSPLSFVEASTPGTGGFIDTPNQRLSIQHISPITNASNLGEVTIEDTAGRALRLSDVASVVEDHQPLIGDAVVDGSPGLMLVIEKFPEVGTLEVTEDVEDAIEELTPGLPGMTIDTTVYRPAGYVEDGLGYLGLAFLIGLVLLLLVVGVGLRDWRAALVSLVTVGLSLLAALASLHVLDVTTNVMILAGLVIALAAIVDDSIADLEAVRRRLRERPGDDELSLGELIVAAAVDVRRPLTAATVILIVIATPALVLPGLSGEFAEPLVLAYVLAVVASLVVALTVTPALTFVLRPQPRPDTPAWLTSLRSRYADGVARLAAERRAVYAAVGLGAVLALVAIPLANDRRILPTFHESDVLIEWNGPPGTSQPEMARIVARASAELDALPGVSDVGGQIGRAITSDKVVSVNASELWLTIDDDADYDETLAAIDDVVDGYPGLFSQVRTYPREQVQEVRMGTGGDLVVRVYGQDLATLETKAEELVGALDEVEGLTGVHIDYDPVEPTVEVEVDLAAAEQYQIKPGDVRRAAAILLSGVEVGSLFEEQKVFEVVVWGTPEIRHSLTSVDNLMIDRPGGGRVRLGDVADVRLSPNPNVIKRDAVSRRVDVVAEVEGRGSDDVRDDVQAVIGDTEFPVEYHAAILETVSSASTNRNVWAVGIAAAVALFLVLQALFGSWRLSALVSLTLPVAISGGAVAAGAASGPLTLTAGLALLAVLGFAIRQAASLVTAYQERSLRGEDHAEAVATVSNQRLVPIVTASLGIAVLMLPAIVLGDRPGLEVVRPIAIVVLCGLVTATLYALFLLPALYLRFAVPAATRNMDSPGEPGEKGWS